MLAIRAGRYDDAIAYAKSLQRVLPRSALGHTLEGDALRAAGKPNEAIAAYRAALERGGQGGVALGLFSAMRQAGDTAGADAFIDRWRAEHPEDLVALETSAAAAYQRGARDEARVLYERLVELRPNHALALNNLAWMYHQASDGRALDTARRAHEAAPSDPNVLDTYGWLLVENGQTEQGLTQLQRAVELAPDSPTSRYHLAAALAKAGDTDAALGVLSELLDSGVRFGEETEARLLRDQLRSN